MHGKGTGSKDAPKFYNISIADEKEVILIVSTAGQKAGIMRAILEKAGPDSKAGSIVFSIPTTEVAGFGVLDSSKHDNKKLLSIDSSFLRSILSWR